MRDGRKEYTRPWEREEHVAIGRDYGDENDYPQDETMYESLVEGAQRKDDLAYRDDVTTRLLETIEAFLEFETQKNLARLIKDNF